MAMLHSDADRELRLQHLAFLRLAYDGHNRRSGLTTMHRLHLRHLRRIWRRRLATWAPEW